MAKKPIEETGVSEAATVEAPEPASTEPVVPEGYTLIKTEELDELRMQLRMSR